ncbi:10470_t:CDS:2 [Ambispora gerdemannii]|uniref:10470_t:CDS:1 n=1 Tax=Ambispora gerdemannii TaxID=144530 RepID=A0A9N8Z9X5_9GLOM|nr:10470_t:CDS:2 [Ambispora gerdemannii]
MAFSGAVILTDLNDYIAPSQACIKPVEIKKNQGDGAPVSIKIDDFGGHFEVSQDGSETKLETASITLNDCLACSGCITSAESILVSMQSHEELYKVFESNRVAIEQGKTQDVKTVVVSIAPQSRASIAAKYRLTPLQVAQRITHFLKSLGVDYVFDTSFSRDFSLIESAREFVERYRVLQEKQSASRIVNNDGGDVEGLKPKRIRRAGNNSRENSFMVEARLPMLASSCPGWICYAEKTHGFTLPYISETKSPQQIMGVLVKDYLANKIGVKPNQIYHVSVMMCYDKKLEASREDFINNEYHTHDVDCVITSGELDKMFEEQNFKIAECTTAMTSSFDSFTKMNSEGNLLGTSGTGSGGFLEYILSYAAKELFGVSGVDVDQEEGVVVKIGKNKDFKEISLEIDGKSVLKFASAYGFRNIQNLIRKIKTSSSPYHYVEVMACPSGCINGGGQLKPTESSISVKDWINQVDKLYRSVDNESPENNESVQRLYIDWLEGKDSLKCRKIMRTQYHAVEQTLINPLTVKW